MPKRRFCVLGRALTHPVRASLCKDIHAGGASSIAELAQRSGVDVAVVRYHVRVLIALGFVQAGQAGEVTTAT